MRCGMVNEVFRKPTSWNWKGDKKRGLGKNRFAIGLEVAYVAVLIIFTMYMLLDTFVLSEKITVVDNAQTTSTGKDTTGGTAKSSTGSGSSSSDTRARRSGSSGKITMYLLWQTAGHRKMRDYPCMSLRNLWKVLAYRRRTIWMVAVRQQCILTVRL